ncbi:hypothetical protein [Streptomyces sp. NPDC050164]|uniref:hypothetical protein n=1 Tax=Streptomyces sp. NPDC050164 TaxID=3365605 RepID=UPI0037B16FE6
MPTASIALLMALVGLVACSSGGSSDGGAPDPSGGGPSSAPAPTRAMSTWVGKVCTADKDLQAQQGAARVAALSYVPRKPTREQLAHFVRASHEGLQEKAKEFLEIGPSPVAGADEVTAAYVAALQGAAAEVGKARKTLAGASSSDVFTSTFPMAVADDVNSAVPKDADLPSLLSRNPALEQAYKASPDCQGLTPLTLDPAPTPSA